MLNQLITLMNINSNQITALLEHGAEVYMTLEQSDRLQMYKDMFVSMTEAASSPLAAEDEYEVFVACRKAFVGYMRLAKEIKMEAKLYISEQYIEMDELTSLVHTVDADMTAINEQYRDMVLIRYDLDIKRLDIKIKAVIQKIDAALSPDAPVLIGKEYIDNLSDYRAALSENLNLPVDAKLLQPDTYMVFVKNTIEKANAIITFYTKRSLDSKSNGG